MTLLLNEVEIEQSFSSVLERNRENYSRVCQKLTRYLSRDFRNKPRGQQPSIWRLFYLVREAIRLNARINGSDLTPNGAALNMVISLEAYVSFGVTEEARKKALRIAIDICQFFCSEVREEVD